MNNLELALLAVCFGGMLFVFWRASIAVKKFYGDLSKSFDRVEGFFSDESNRKKLKQAATDILAQSLERGVLGIYEKIIEKRKEGEVKTKKT